MEAPSSPSRSADTRRLRCRARIARRAKLGRGSSSRQPTLPNGQLLRSYLFTRAQSCCVPGLGDGPAAINEPFQRCLYRVRTALARARLTVRCVGVSSAPGGRLTPVVTQGPAPW